MLDMSAANLSTTPDGGLMSEPFQGHSEKQPPPMCQRLHNAIPHTMGRATFRQIARVFSPIRRQR